MTYIRDHWRGGHSFAWSFWVNLVLLRAAIFWLEGFTGPPFLDDPHLFLPATIAFFAVFHVIVFAWQAVGVLRAGDRYLADLGTPILVPAACVGIMACAILTSVSAFGILQALFAERTDTILAEEWEHERAGRYELTLGDGGRLIRLTGDFEHGLTNNLASLLRNNPGVEGIVLSSDGGYVAEGRGVARLIRERRLDTYVFAVCKSACATAFIGGEARMLGASGRLGFHQYWLDRSIPAWIIDPQAEQRKDARFFRQQGIEAAFLERLFDKPHQEIWYPTADELIEAGVVQEILGDDPAGAAGVAR